jgi:hypothetical protein
MPSLRDQIAALAQRVMRSTIVSDTEFKVAFFQAFSFQTP